MAVQDWIDKIVSGLKALVELGLILVVVFLVIDVLLGPDAGLSEALTGSGIVTNVASVIDAFIDEGVVGLIVLLIILAIYQK